MSAAPITKRKTKADALDVVPVQVVCHRRVHGAAVRVIGGLVGGGPAVDGLNVVDKGLDVGREDQEERDDAEGPDNVQADEEVCATRQREPWPL